MNKKEKCSYCGQWGDLHTECKHCGAAIDGEQKEDKNFVGRYYGEDVFIFDTDCSPFSFDETMD